MRLIDEPQYRHGTQPRVGVLAINLGTPEAPTAAALRPYLAEFLADPRVVEIPRLLWMPILHGIILRTRPAKSAKKYASVWMPEGSPLMVWSRRQVSVLQGTLGERCKAAGLPADHVIVELAMRYGKPSIAAGIEALKKAGCDRILMYPLYPQYASATTATASDEVFAQLRRYRWQPGVRVIDRFHDDPGYIGAMAARINEYWMRHRRPDKLVLSFHGVPRFSLDRGDPYHCQCQKTARLLSNAMGRDLVVSFQSKLGRAKWLEPSTEETLARLGREGVKSVAVVTPGFIADNLETLEEIAIRGRETFVEAGGTDFAALECLNASTESMELLQLIVGRELEGWLPRV